MGTRIKTFVATGIAPDGRLFAGDLNAMEDQYADLSNLAQTLGVGSIQVGESGLQIVRYGTGEMRISGALRTDGIFRGLGGLYAGAFTTTQRDAIALGSRPYGLVILNTTNNRLEINIGSDTTPSWTSLGASIASGILASRPGASTANANSWYFATDDNGGTLYYSTGSGWTKVSKGLTEAPIAHAASHLGGGSDAISWGTIHQYGTLAARPAAASSNTGYLYFATDDQGGTLYRSSGSTWNQIARGLTQAITSAMIPANAVSLSQLQSLFNNPWLALTAGMIEGVLPAWGTTPQTTLQITAGGGWSVSMNSGRALVQGDDNNGQGMYVYDSSGSTPLTLVSTTPANPRVDVIALQLNDAAYTGRTPVGWNLVQVQGTPTAGADLTNRNGAPTLPASAIWLADYLMVNGDASATNARIADRRKLAGPGVWGEDNHLYRIGVDNTGLLGLEQVA